MASHESLDTQYEGLWQQACAAAQKAAIAANAALPPEAQRGFDCGFAWITMPGNLRFARWLMQNGIASKNHPSGVMIWYSRLHNLPTQSISVHEAAAKAARDVLAHGLQTSQIGMASRLD